MKNILLLVLFTYSLMVFVSCNSASNIPKVNTQVVQSQDLPPANWNLAPKNKAEAEVLAKRLQDMQSESEKAMHGIIAMGEFKRPVFSENQISAPLSYKQPTFDPSLLSPPTSNFHGGFFTQQSNSMNRATPAHGYTGWAINNTMIDGFSASNTANTSVDMPTDPYIFGNRVVYAPTTKTPNSCVEILTATVKQNYFWIPALYHEFWAWNWCSGVGGKDEFKLPIDSNFINKYMRVLSQSASPEPEYIYITQKQADGRWHVYLYNFITNSYDDVYSPLGTVPDSVGNGGWTMFEMYVYGACPFYLPTIYNEVVQVRIAGIWRHLSLSDGGSFNSNVDCSENGFYSHLIRSTKQPAQTPFSAAQNLSSSSTVQASVSINSISGRTVILRISVNSLGKKDGTTTLGTGNIYWGDSGGVPFYENQVGGWIYLTHTYPAANTWHITITSVDNQFGLASNSIDVTTI